MKRERTEVAVEEEIPRVLRWVIGEALQYAAAVVGIGGVVYALWFDGRWSIAGVAGAVVVLLEVLYWMDYLRLKIEGYYLKRELAERRAEIERLEATNARMQELYDRQEAGLIRLQMLASQKEAEAAQKEALASQLRMEKLELQRAIAAEMAMKAEQERLAETRAAKVQQLESVAACLEARASQVELQMEQMRIRRDFTRLEELAQERIQNAYLTGFMHGRHEVRFTGQNGRHLRAVNSSA